MTDTTNWSCPDCGGVVASGTEHRCGGFYVHVQHPLEAENARLRAALDVAVEALERYAKIADCLPDFGDIATDALATIRQKMQEPPQEDGSAPD